MDNMTSQPVISNDIENTAQIATIQNIELFNENEHADKNEQSIKIDRRKNAVITKRYVGKNLTKSQILDARRKCLSAGETARYLRVSVLTLKKYAKMYDLWDEPGFKNECGFGIKTKGWGGPNGPHIKYPLDELLQGKYPEYNRSLFKQRLINSNYLEHKCHICGYNEKRSTDGTYPFMLDFLDGNCQNFKIRNVKYICYNCYYITIGNMNCQIGKVFSNTRKTEPTTRKPVELPINETDKVGLGNPDVEWIPSVYKT